MDQPFMQRNRCAHTIVRICWLNMHHMVLIQLPQKLCHIIQSKNQKVCNTVLRPKIVLDKTLFLTQGKHRTNISFIYDIMKYTIHSHFSFFTCSNVDIVVAAEYVRRDLPVVRMYLSSRANIVITFFYRINMFVFYCFSRTIMQIPCM